MKNGTNNINTIVGDLIRFHREKAGVRQEYLADEIGKSRPSLVNIEQGRQNINIETLYRISEVLQIPVAAFLPDTKAQNELAAIHAEFERKMAEWTAQFKESE